MTVPVTSRPMAEGEEQGREYDFVTPKEFELVGLGGRTAEIGTTSTNVLLFT